MKQNAQKKFSRKFGKLHVEVNGADISIVGDWNSNFGHFYPESFDSFKSYGSQTKPAWPCPQVVGMDWDYGIAAQESPVRKWLHGLILSGKLDYLTA